MEIAEDRQAFSCSNKPHNHTMCHAGCNEKFDNGPLTLRVNAMWSEHARVDLVDQIRKDRPGLLVRHYIDECQDTGDSPTSAS